MGKKESANPSSLTLDHGRRNKIGFISKRDIDKTLRRGVLAGAYFGPTKSLAARLCNCMETTLTEFRSNFRSARAAADRGETVTVKSALGNYVFVRAAKLPDRPFALEPLIGIVRLPSCSAIPNGTIHYRLKARRTG